MPSPTIVSRSRFLKSCAVAAVVSGAALVGVATGGRLQAAAQGNVTTSPVYWMWDTDTTIGSSRLVRTESGLSAVFHATGVPKGHAMTLWFGVLNNPEHCATRPCTLPDFFNPLVQGDFLWGGGIVTGGSGKNNLGGHLKVGDSSGSAFLEFGNLDAAVGLINPLRAEVMLLVHSHGPAVPGTVLKSQISSFTGGCSVYLGPDGFAAGPQDIPDEIGECSTFQVSIHQ